ncbi:carbohydrate ABC transporter permease [Actinospica robiniae]|uniref:carbohydrate ABC transporter permease n=1 Tax=Actinospica robiniae TaxID=304901 RepID=UPI0003FC627D|nr:carbohydrate ABC transporter permease [Actinospica robiniae]
MALDTRTELATGPVAVTSGARPPIGGSGDTNPGDTGRKNADRNRALRKRLRQANPIAGAASFAWLLVVLVPVYVMVNASFMPQSSALGGKLLQPAANFTLANYRLVLQSGFLHLLLNNVLVTVATMALVLVLSVPLAFTIVRAPDTKGMLVFRVFLLGLAIPAPVIIVPLSVMVAKMGIYDSLWAIILPTAAFAMPVTLLVLVGTMRDISEELYEAMALDGAGPLRMMLTLAVPLSKGGISTVSVFTGLAAWNGLLFPLILTQSPENEVLTTGLWNLSSEYGLNLPATLAALTLSGIPMLAVYLLARRALISGVMGVGGK